MTFAVTLEQWRAMPPEHQADFFLRGISNEAMAPFIETLLASDGATADDAASLFAASRFLEGDAATNVAMVRQFARRWVLPDESYPRTVGAEVADAACCYPGNPLPVSVFSDARERDLRRCPFRAAEIAAEFLNAFQMLRFAFTNDSDKPVADDGCSAAAGDAGNTTA